MELNVLEHVVGVSKEATTVSGKTIAAQSAEVLTVGSRPGTMVYQQEKQKESGQSTYRKKSWFLLKGKGEFQKL